MTESVDAHSATSACDVRSLGGGVVVIVCETAARLRTSPKLETLTGEAPSPLTTLRLPLANGGTRVLWAFRRPADRDLVFRAFAGVLSQARLVEVRRDEAYPAIDLAAVAGDLETKGRLSLISALFGVWATAFKLRHNQSFVRAAQKMVAEIAPEAASAVIETGLADGHALLKTLLPADLGDVQTIYVVSATGVDHLPRHWQVGEAARRGKRPLHFVGRGDINPADRIVIVGARGMVIRRPVAKPSVPSLAGWWRTRARTGDQLREFIVRALSGTATDGRAAAIEFQLRSPLRGRSLRGQGGLPSASVEIALAGPSGLFAAGWFRDPVKLVSHLDVEDEAGASHRIAWHQFPGPAPSDPKVAAPTGFVGFAKGYRVDAPVLQPRFRLHLTTGTSHVLIPRPQPVDPAERRALALRAVPPQHLSGDLMETCLSAALADLQAAFRAVGGEPHVETIGDLPARPEISVVVPLYRNLDFVQAQVAAFALDPAFRREAEVVYVLDSPEQAAEVRQYLQGLGLLYRLPFVFVVMPRNAGYAAACNAGAKVARGALLAMVNSDVVPCRPGWLSLLAKRMSDAPELGVCGPKLLFEDGSIQHAGMYFARNHFGRWLNHHFHKGMPRDYAPATVERLVPAVTGACLVVRRALFDEAGGFTEDYVIGDYEDSDLCLKVRAAGHEIAYVPAAELYHFERQSIRHHEDYMRGTADRYNAWLHARRWGEAMHKLMSPPLHETLLRSAA